MTILITAAAEKDMKSAAAYIDNNLMNPQAANDLLDEAERTILSLRSYPAAHPLAEDPVLRAWNIRHANIKNYLLFYTVSEDDGQIRIVRFLHSRQNWAALLKQETL